MTVLADTLANDCITVIERLLERVDMDPEDEDNKDLLRLVDDVLTRLERSNT